MTQRIALQLTLVGLLAMLSSGCMTFGLLYEDVGHPPIHVTAASRQGDGPQLGVDTHLNASFDGRAILKRGYACSEDVLKLVAWGNGTQAAAARKAGITEIVGVDFQNTAILGFIYTRNCTVVYGR